MKLLTVSLASLLIVVSANSFACVTFTHEGPFKSCGNGETAYDFDIKGDKIGGMPMMLGDIANGKVVRIEYNNKIVKDCSVGNPISVTYKITPYTDRKENGICTARGSDNAWCKVTVGYKNSKVTSIETTNPTHCKVTTSGNEGFVKVYPE